MYYILLPLAKCDIICFYTDIRKKEINVIEKSLLTQSLLSGQPTLVPIIAAVATFLAMTLSKVDLTVTQVNIYIDFNKLYFTNTHNV